jgi:large subunit ribosomal protein L10e
MSVRARDAHESKVIEALRRAKFKYPGRQKIYVSSKWGFTKFERADFENMREEGLLIPDGVGVQYKPHKGPLQAWKDRQ